jgi:hypothetical protein
MSRKVWHKPEIQVLSIGETAHGHTVTPHVDATRSSHGHTFFSFS